MELFTFFPPFHYYVFSTMVAIMNIYIFCAVAMFCILAWALACKFSQLDEQLNELRSKDVDLGVFSVRHLLVCEAVGQFEKYFQNIMLVSISIIFTQAINLSSHAYFFFEKGMYTVMAAYLLEGVVALVLLDAICNVAERLKDEVCK